MPKRHLALSYVNPTSPSLCELEGLSGCMKGGLVPGVQGIFFKNQETLTVVSKF